MSYFNPTLDHMNIWEKIAILRSSPLDMNCFLQLSLTKAIGMSSHFVIFPVLSSNAYSHPRPFTTTKHIFQGIFCALIHSIQHRAHNTFILRICIVALQIGPQDFKEHETIHGCG